MSEASPEEIKGLTDRIDTLAKAVEQLTNAETAREKKAAETKVESAQSGLAAYAQAHGLTEEEAEQAFEAVRANKRRGEVRDVLRSLIQEEWDDLFPEETEEEKKEREGKEKEEKAAKPAAKAKAEPAKPAEDEGPVGEHWTDRRVFGG